MKQVRYSMAGQKMMLLLMLAGLLALIVTTADASESQIKSHRSVTHKAISPPANNVIYFARNWLALSASAKAILQQYAHYYLDRKAAGVHLSIELEGYTDKTGPREYNLALSARMSSEARDYLQSNGVNQHDIVVIGKGEENPQCRGSSRRCLDQNRRVEITLQRRNQ